MLLYKRLGNAHERRIIPIGTLLANLLHKRADPSEDVPVKQNPKASRSPLGTPRIVLFEAAGHTLAQH